MRISSRYIFVIGFLTIFLVSCADTNSAGDSSTSEASGEESDRVSEENGGDELSEELEGEESSVDEEEVSNDAEGDATTSEADVDNEADGVSDATEDVLGTVTGACEFWVQNCAGESNCYPESLDFECKEPTGSGDEADDCENDTDCSVAGLLCSPDGCAIACSIDELVEGDAPICVDNCQFGYEVLNLDLQLGYCLPDTTPGEWIQLQPETVKKEHVFKGIWMSSPDDIHLVGADGIAVHYQGDYWEILTEGFWSNLNGVWGFAPDDVWAVGYNGTIIHYDGVKWSEPGGCVDQSDCDDNNDCTIDACDSAGICSNTPSGADGCCGEIYYTEGWDSGTLEGWVVEEIAGGPLVTWQPFSHVGSNGTERYTSPFTALYFGNPEAPCLNPADGVVCPNYTGDPLGGVGNVWATVVSPPVALASGVDLGVSFNLWADVEGGQIYDTLALSVVDESGVESVVWQKDAAHASFENYSADISQWQGQTVQFKFEFNSIDSFANATEGIYIDDFTVEYPCADSGLAPVDTNDIPTLFDIWGSSADDIYAVGLQGFVGKYDGKSWKEVDFSDVVGPWGFKGLFGFGNSIHLVGDGGLIMKEDQFGFGSENSGTVLNLSKVWGNSPSDLYAVGDNGTILHNQGGGWLAETVGTIANVKGVWGAGSFEVVAVGSEGTILRKKEGNWSDEPSSTSFDLRDVWGLGSKSTWAVGDSGMVVHYDGTAWLPEVSSTLKPLNSIHGSSPEDIWAVGEGGAIIRNDGSGWSDVSSVITQTWFDVWALGDGSAVVVGDLGLIIRGDGVQWSEMYHPMGSEPIETVWGRSADDLYAAGNGFILHYDGNEERTWTLHASTVELATWRGVCGSGPDNVMVVGATGKAISWNGKTWGRVPVEPKTEATADAPAEYYTEQLHGCWTIDKDTAWAVGEGGLILELVNGEFKKAENLIPVSLRDVFAFSKDLVFAVGIEGVILSSRGIESTWLPIYSGTVAGLFGIMGTSLEDITAVGDLGTIQRFLPFYDALGVEAPLSFDEVDGSEEEGGSGEEAAGESSGEEEASEEEETDETEGED